MRIERTGPVEPLTPRIEAFLKEALGGISLDDVQSPDQLRADYACLRGLLAVELKTLEDDGSERMDNLFAELRERDDWPIFLGSAPIQAFIENTADPDGLRKQTLERIGRGVINHLKKANRQLEAHCVSFPRRNTVRALVLVNEDHETYDPHTVSFILWHAVRRLKDDRLLYEHIDLIFYFTERHAQIVDNRVAFPTLIVEGKPIGDAPWKSEFGTLVAERWARWNGVPLHRDEAAVNDFSTIEHVPDSMKRYEAWNLNYRRQPYLSGLTNDQLRDRFDEVNVMIMLWGVYGSPVKVVPEARTQSVRMFGDLMQEMARRAIPVTQFPHVLARSQAAAKRLGLHQAVADWLAELEQDRDARGAS